MTIEINRPETEALIAHYLKSGEYDSADELVAVAINALRDKRPADETTSLTNGERRKLEGRKSLAELFAESAFKGLNMEFDESEDARAFSQNLYPVTAVLKVGRDMFRFEDSEGVVDSELKGRE